MSDELTRLRIENNMSDKASVIDVTKPDAAWLDDPGWEAFQDACNDLVHYCAEQGETVIGPLALGEYVYFTRLLRKALMSGELDARRHEQVEEALISLEGWMDEIRKETMTNLRYDHPEMGL